MANETIAFLLLRSSLRALLEDIHHTLLPDASMWEEGLEKPIARFAELLQEALRYKLHGRDWYLHGTSIQRTHLGDMEYVNRNNLSYRERLASVDEMGRTYSWSLFPWGCYGTGQMVAFISPDAAIFAKAMKYLAAGNKGLVISSYSAEELRNEQFKGGICLGAGESAAGELLKCNISSDSMLVLTSYPEHRPVEMRNAEIVLEASGHQIGNPVRRRWLRVNNEGVLKQFLLDRNTVIVTAPDLDQRVMWLAVQDFAHVADHITQDPLYFGAKVLESATWIYIPASSDEGCEIYWNHDPEATRTFFSSKDFASLPHFFHRYFC
jgi:hypothetical protein